MQDRYIAPGSNTDLASMLPNVPGASSAPQPRRLDHSQWDWTPSGYLFGLHGRTKPLIQRVDPSDTGLPRGLTMVAENEEYLFRGMHWQHRFGFGVGNRLNGVAVQIVRRAATRSRPLTSKPTPGPLPPTPAPPSPTAWSGGGGERRSTDGNTTNRNLRNASRQPPRAGSRRRASACNSRRASSAIRRCRSPSYLKTWPPCWNR